MGIGQERLDLLLLEILAQEAVDVAGEAGEHLALPAFLGDPPEQRIGMNDGLDDHRRRAGNARRPPRRPNRPRPTASGPGRAARASGTGSPGGVDIERPSTPGSRRSPAASRPPGAGDARCARRQPWRSISAGARAAARQYRLGPVQRLVPCIRKPARSLSARRLLAGQREDIAFAPHGPQEFRIGRVFLDLLAQPHDADVNGARIFGILGQADRLRNRRASRAAGWRASETLRARRTRSWPCRECRPGP